ncbi:glycosyltransferase family 9 protein [Candidatus Pacearchaeota archaeon]|nr:glycosyltransferase family 9 protein [Candidatus Pacearchaeota archaeon]
MEKVLLIPICGLGDAICYLPSIMAVRDKYPNAKIVTIVTTEEAREIIKNISLDISVIVFNRKSHGGLLSLLKILIKIRSQQFDMVMSRAPKSSVRIPILAFLSGAKKRVGAKYERLSFLYNNRVNVSNKGHAFERYGLMIKGAGITSSSMLNFPTILPTEKYKKSAETIWKRAELDGYRRVVGLASGADTNLRGKWNPLLKKWSVQNYAKVVRWLIREAQAQVVMFGTKHEAALADEITDLAGIKMVSLCGKTSIGELQWLINKCQVLITNDTGTMHLSAALGTPVIALFGPTDPKEFGPLGKDHKIIQGQADCSPCYPSPTCNLTECKAMGAINPSEIIKYLSSIFL